MPYKARYAINLHKATTMPVIIGLMYYYDNFGIGPYIYLGLHGTYGALWLLKECCFPDKNFDRPLHPILAASLYLFLGPFSYWIAPFLLIRSGVQPSPPLVCLAVSLHLLGTFSHFCGDCQKYYTLKYHKGLIQEGMFSHSRNINYFGEILIYLAFNILAQHWLPFIVQALLVAFVFYPNMKAKDQSLSRYKGFDIYKSKTWLLLPKLL